MLKKRTLALLLSLAMLLTFMPAMAFAEDAADDAEQPEAVEKVEEAIADETAAEEPEAEAVTEQKEALDAVTEGDEEDPGEVEGGVKSLTYTGPTLYYEPGDSPSMVYPYVDSATFDITYSDGTKKVVVKEYGDEWRAFFFDDENPLTEKGEDGDEYPVNAIWLDFDYDAATVEKGLPVSYGGASTTIPVAEKEYPKPTKIEFVPAGDFVASSEIGEDYLGSYCFYGEGNKFIVTWKTGDATEVKNYVCKEDKDGWVFCYTDGKSEEWFWPEIKLDKKIAKGIADYSGNALVESEYGTIQLPISVKVSAEMYKAYAEFKTYSYTGKSIKPKVVVKYYDGSKMKKMPAKWYTCKPKKYKAIGEYSYVVKIKKKYQAKYGAALYGYWDILPKTPVIKKVTAGTGSVTVTWTKFSKKLQKSIDGFYIRVSDDKNFNYWFEEIGAKPGDSKATITGLEKDKQYYVGIFSYKSLKGDGSPWESKPSKIKPFKVK